MTTLLKAIKETSALTSIRLTDFSVNVEDSKFILRTADESEDMFQAIVGLVDNNMIAITMTDAGILMLLVKQDGSVRHGLLVNPETNSATALLIEGTSITTEELGEVHVHENILKMTNIFFSSNPPEHESRSGLMIGDGEIMFIPSMIIIKHLNQGLQPMPFADISELLLLFTHVDEPEDLAMT